MQNDMLAKLVDSTHRDWDSKIPSILSAYRTAKNESTGFSPFYIIYGRDPVLPVDTLLSPKYRYQREEYVPTMLENMHKAHHHVQYNLAMSHERNKLYYDRKAKPVKIRVGDMVYFRDPSDAAQSSKLTSHWKPFYRVIKALSEVTFVIKNQLSGYTKVVNAQNLRLANSETEWKNISDEPSHIDSKYQEKYKSYIPIRVQPPRRSKYSAVDDDDLSSSERDSEQVSDSAPTPSSAPQVRDRPSSSSPHERSESPPFPNVADFPDLPVSDSDQFSSDDEVPLSELQKRWKRKKEVEIEENLPLSELLKRSLRKNSRNQPKLRGFLSKDRAPFQILPFHLIWKHNPHMENSVDMSCQIWNRISLIWTD